MGSDGLLTGSSLRDDRAPGWLVQHESLGENTVRSHPRGQRETGGKRLTVITAPQEERDGEETS